MSKLFNFFIGLLILLFFVAVGWSFIKSSSFINEQTAKLKAGTNSLTENASAMGQNITDNASAMGQSISEMPGKAKDYIEEGVSDIKEGANEVKEKLNATATTEGADIEAEKLAQEEAAKSAAADAKAAADKAAANEETFKVNTKKDIPQEYDAASKKGLNAGSTNMAAAAKAPYMVITGSFSQATNADLQMKELKKKGYSPESVHLGTTKYLSVVAGRYQTLQEAQAISAQLKKEGIKEAYVQKRKVRK